MGYTNEEALPFVVKLDLGNLSCNIYIYIYIYITAYRLYNIQEMSNIHTKRKVRQLIHHRNGRNRWNKILQTWPNCVNHISLPWRYIQGEEVQPHSFLTLATEWCLHLTLTLDTLLPGEGVPLPTEQEARWTLEPFWMFWEERKSLAPARIWTSDHPGCTHASVLTKPSWLTIYNY